MSIDIQPPSGTAAPASAAQLLAIRQGLGLAPPAGLLTTTVETALGGPAIVKFLGDKVGPGQFGLTGNYNPITYTGADDTTALQALLDYTVKHGCVLHLKPGYYKSGPLRLGVDSADSPGTTGADSAFGVVGAGSSGTVDGGTQIHIIGTGSQMTHALALRKSAWRDGRIEGITLRIKQTNNQHPYTPPANEAAFGALHGLAHIDSYFTHWSFRDLYIVGALNPFAVLGSTYQGNGEFNLYEHVTAEQCKRFFYMASGTGQAFGQKFIACNMLADMHNTTGITAFELGGGGGYGFQAIGFDSTIAFDPSKFTGATSVETMPRSILLKNNGYEGPVTFTGGRNEGYTTLYANANVNYAAAITSMTGVDMAGLYSGTANPTVLETTFDTKGIFTFRDGVLPVIARSEGACAGAYLHIKCDQYGFGQYSFHNSALNVRNDATGVVTSTGLVVRWPTQPTGFVDFRDCVLRTSVAQADLRVLTARYPATANAAAVGAPTASVASSGGGGGGGGNTINAASLSVADIQSAITSASTGDTVQLPAGTATHTTAITCNKAIHIRGAGGGRCEGLSTTSLAVGTGSKSFTLALDNRSQPSWFNDFVVGETITARCRYNASPSMTGTVTSWNSTTRVLVLNIASITGSGTFAYWIFTTPAETTLTVSTGASPNWELTESTAGSMQISGIRFVGGTQSDGGAHIRLNTAAGGKPILVHDNRFSAGGGRIMKVETNKGVIYRNYFDAGFNWDAAGNNLVPGYGIAVKHGLSASWTSANTVGANDTTGEANVYIEENLFTGFTTEAADPDDNSRTVIRHNILDNSGIASHGQDTSIAGLRHMEVYNNRGFFNDLGAATANMNYWVFQRGGSAIYTDNAFPDISSGEWGNKGEVTLMIEQLRRNAGPNACWSSGYPSPRQPGQGHNGTTTIVEGVYFWNNSGSPTMAAGDYTPDECGGGPAVAGYLQLNRDFFTRAPQAGEALNGYTKYTYPHPLRPA